VIVLAIYLFLFLLTGIIVTKIRNKLDLIKSRKEEIRYKRRLIEEVINPKPNYEPINWFEYYKIPEEERIKEKIAKVDEALISAIDYNLKEYIETLKLMLYKLKRELIKIESKKELDYIRAQKRLEEKEIEELEQRKREIVYELEEDKREILRKLDTENNRVFKKENLSKKECQALIEDGYKQANEYCVNEKKRITVLVKPFGNHTIAHEFLVWSIKRLIRKIKGARKIQEHLTRDADLTFEFEGREFAIEIEKGELLRKQEQLREKINYLNKKYPKRWVIVVSNRDFFTRYKKFGFTSTRARLGENLAKLLLNTHTKIPHV